MSITRLEKQAEKIKENIQANAWDGDWYLRAFFDDGTPLGSSKNEECKIDSISQEKTACFNFFKSKFSC